MTARGLAAALAAAAEFLECSEPNALLNKWLASCGVDVAHAWDVAGPICAHSVTLWPRRIFNFSALEAEGETFSEDEPAERADHVRAVVHIARDVDDETPIDLIAWQPQQPARIFRHLSQAVMLGASQLGNPASYFAGEPLPVHRTALDWLVAGCRGVVILDPKEFLVRLSALPERPGGYALAAADLPHAKLLRASIGSVDRVQVLVPVEEAA
jgi:hypothetical protein